MILEYQIMKYDGDLGRPHFYVPLSEDICQDKIAGLFRAFHPKPADNGSTSRHSGHCCGYAASSAMPALAEAFFVRKVVA